MSILGQILGEGVSKPIEAIGNIITKLFPSDVEKMSKQALLERLAQEPQMAQIEINKIQAQHPSVFVSGARPAILWVCAIGLGVYFIPQYVMASILWTKHCWLTGSLAPYPVSPKGLIDLVIALCGLAGLRTIEKIKGVARQ